VTQVQSYAGLKHRILPRRCALGQQLSRLFASILQRADEDGNTGRIIYGRRTISVSRTGYGKKLRLLVGGGGHGVRARGSLVVVVVVIVVVVVVLDVVVVVVRRG